MTLQNCKFYQNLNPNFQFFYTYISKISVTLQFWQWSSSLQRSFLSDPCIHGVQSMSMGSGGNFWLIFFHFYLPFREWGFCGQDESLPSIISLKKALYPLRYWYYLSDIYIRINIISIIIIVTVKYKCFEYHDIFIYISQVSFKSASKLILQQLSDICRSARPQGNISHHHWTSSFQKLNTDILILNILLSHLLSHLLFVKTKQKGQQQQWTGKGGSYSGMIE